jgi:sugar-phosphatase
MLKGIQAVIFDLDGLMIDSEPLSKKAWKLLLAEYDQDLSDAEFRLTIGLDSLATSSLLKGLKGLDEDVERLDEEIEGLRLEIIQTEAEAVDGLGELIRILIEGELKIGVASNSPLAYVEAALEAVNLRNHFPCVMGVDQVASGKPEPDLYLGVAKCLSVEPAHCLALEDSPSGMRSALAAGMRCVVVPNHDLRGADFAGAFARFESLVDLTAAMDELLTFQA